MIEHHHHHPVKKLDEYSERDRILRTEALGAHILNIYRYNDMTYYMLCDSKTRIQRKPMLKNKKIQKNQSKMSKKYKDTKERMKMSLCNSNFWFLPSSYMNEKDIRNEAVDPFER